MGFLLNVEIKDDKKFLPFRRKKSKGK